MTGRNNVGLRWTAENGCPTSKRAFASRGDARGANRLAMKSGLTRMSPYLCQRCGMWHLGHLPNAVKRGIAPRSSIQPRKRDQQ